MLGPGNASVPRTVTKQPDLVSVPVPLLPILRNPFPERILSNPADTLDVRGAAMEALKFVMAVTAG